MSEHTKAMNDLNDNIKFLVEVWIQWVEHFERSFNTALTTTERYNSSIKCEELQSKRLDLIQLIDKNFEYKIIRSEPKSSTKT